MTVVPALDLRGGTLPLDPDHVETTPANIEAEQALLGSILFDNEAFGLIEVDLDPLHFYEPIHQRLYRSMSGALRLGLMVDPVVLMEEFRRDAAFKDLGGIRYLADMVDRAPPAANAPDYARTIFELANLRALIRIGQQVTALAKGTLVDEETGARYASAQIIETAERDLLAVQLTGRGHGTGVVDLHDAAKAVLAYVDDKSPHGGVTTGLNPLDIRLGPMMGGDLILLAGRPSMGKSALALAIGGGVAAPALTDYINGRDHDGRPPRGVFELHGEMGVNDGDGGQVARRHLADIGYGLYGPAFPTYKAIRDKKVSVDQREMLANAAGNLAGVPIRAIKRTGLKLSTIRSMVRRQVAAWGRAGIEPGLVIVDHVGLLRPDGRTSGRYEAQTEIAIGLKELADDLGITILALVQLSRDIERRDDKKPQLSDLRDSGAYEENADIVMMAYRDAYYAKRETEPSEDKQLAWAQWDARCRSNVIEVIMGKIREGEAGGAAELWGALAWNAIRAGEPDRKGVLL